MSQPISLQPQPTWSDEDRARALTAATGADGYILKSARTATILSQIEGFLDL